MRFVDSLLYLSGIQFYLTSAFVYGGYLPDYALPVSFAATFILLPFIGQSALEKVAVVIASASLAGLPSGDGELANLYDLSGTLGGVSFFTVLALLYGATRVVEQRHNFSALLLIAVVPAIAGLLGLTVGGSEFRFINSEFLKFLAFLCFCIYAVTLRRSWDGILDFVAVLMTVLLVLGVALKAFLNIGYSYGGATYMYAPVSAFIVPLVALFHSGRKYHVLVVLMLVLLGLGYLQPSVKIVLLLALTLTYLGIRSIGIVPSMLLVAASVVGAFYIYPYLPDGLRYKSFSLILLISGNYKELGYLFFTTSAGNIIAELATIVSSLADRLFIPVGAGLSLHDRFGILGLANEFAYPAVAFSSGYFYPFHLGAYYILVWYGICIPVLRPLLISPVFLAVFLLTGMTYKSLIFLAAIVGPHLVPHGKEPQGFVSQQTAQRKKSSVDAARIDSKRVSVRNHNV